MAEFSDEDIKKFSRNAHQNMHNKYPGMNKLEIRARMRFTKELITVMGKNLRKKVQQEIDEAPTIVSIVAHTSNDIHKKMNTHMASISELRRLCKHPYRFELVENHNEYTVIQCPVCYFEKTIMKPK